MHPAMPFRAACIQMRSGVDTRSNIAALENQVAEAVDMGARYVQTPEMTGLVQRSRRELLAAIGTDEACPVLQAARRLAREHAIWLHIGSTAVAVDGDRAANRSALFSPDGTRLGVYDKIHMFDVDLDHGERWRESSLYRPGDRAVVARTVLASFGLAICYDLRFPALFRNMAEHGADVLTCPSCFTRQTGEAHWHVLLRARAIENGAFVLAAAQGGMHEDGRETYGHTIAIDPWGRIIGELDHDEPGILIVDIDPMKAVEARTKIPALSGAKPYRLVVQGRAHAATVPQSDEKVSP